MPDWKHPQLGAFTYDYTGWAREMVFPAFKPFRYDWGGGRRTRDKTRLEFEAEEAAAGAIPLPSKRAVAVALRAIKNESLLADRILNAIWKDLHGRGCETGMWWHGDLATVNEQIAGVFGPRKTKQLSAREDLYDLMGLLQVLIRESTYLHEKPSATFCFAAAFDEEHGVGVLTDGARLLGIGHQSDVTPFK